MSSFSTPFLYSWLSPMLYFMDGMQVLFLCSTILQISFIFWDSPPELLVTQIPSLPKTICREPASDVDLLHWQALVGMNLMLILSGSDYILLTLGMITCLG